MTNFTVGAGDSTYQVIHPFGTLPPGMERGRIRHVAVDSQDRIYVYRIGDPPVLVFDTDGNFLTGWGAGVIADAHGICISPQDEIFAADRDSHEVLKLNTEGKILMRLGQRGRPAFQAPFNHPADVAVSPTGDLFVADGYGNSTVHRFSAEGKHLSTWGTPGAGPGQFSTPHGIWVGPDQRVYVCDRENNRVQLFSPEGDFITQWTDFSHPMDIWMNTQGRVFVTDQVPRLSVLDQQGVLLGRGKTIVDLPHGVWGDSMGNIYTASTTMGVTKYLKL